jgi:hypothetical protein
MTPEQVHLLRALGSGVRPVDLGEPARSGDDRFGPMLQQAIAGNPRTDLSVTFAPGASGLFDSLQQERIARAVDLAAAAGTEHALVLHDRHALRVDVRNRVVLDAPALRSGGVLTGIDGVVSSQPREIEGDASETVRAQQAVISPARVVRNASLVRALAGSQGSDDS